jgi:hypothetical protein
VVDKVGTEVEWPLSEGRCQRVIDHSDRAGFARRRQDGGQIGHGE